VQPIRKRIETRGAARQLLSDRSPEVLTVGAAGTGKSFGALWKIHLMCLLNGKCSPDCEREHEHHDRGMKALIVRQTLKSLTSTGLVTFREQVAADAIAQGIVRWYGGSGEKPAQYIYENGSSIVVGGLDNPDKVMSTEYDCVIGETLIDSVSPIERAYSRPYSGKLITVTTAAGHQLTGTPNHPVLTPHGWRALNQLSEGGHLMRRARSEQESIGGANPDVADQPSSIAEVARAFALANPGRSERVETVAMDFHGDGVPDGYVDVVSADGFFHHAIDPASFDHVIEVDSDGADLEPAPLMAERTSVEVIGARYASTIQDALLFSEFAHASTILGRVAPRLTVAGGGLGESTLPFGVGIANVAERLPFAFGADTNATLGHLLTETAGADVDGLRGGHQPEFPFEVTADRIVKISVTDAGPGRHVYNLQTGSHWYVANEIISHNCIFVQEATDITLESWEKLNSRLRNGRVSFQQLLADCNPQQPSHWLKKRCDEGKTTMLISRHEDNPRLFGDDGELTSYGSAYIARLDNLTGVRYLRLRKGKWAAAEGLIYEDWSPDRNVIDRKVLPMDWPRYWAVDFGYTNPFVWQMWAIDPDGRAYLEKEIYKTKRLVEDHAKDILRVVVAENGKWKYPRPQAVICDHDAEDRATLERHLGFGTVAANKTVSEGIQAVQSRIKVAGDGLPRLFVLRDALVERDGELKQAGLPTCTLEEIEGYVWKPKPGGVLPKEVPDEPLKKDDHGCDAGRYFVAHLDLAPRVRVRVIRPR